MRKKIKFWRYIFFAELLARIGASRLAERVLKKALAAATYENDLAKLADVYSVQASLEERKGEKNGARTLLQKAVEVAPPEEVGMHHCQLALFYKRHHEYRLAATHFENALRLLATHYEEYRSSIQAELLECQGKFD